ncbi:HD domain-containing phosphohydrolase [Aquincola sp. MAHUQ-54]|uniref:HD domain-containing phosphohydrolase n=1 Tax=Aquincola agrisoli TaxID=3119538 RepID=A0AAW9QEK4_9BURK
MKPSEAFLAGAGAASAGRHPVPGALQGRVLLLSDGPVATSERLIQGLRRHCFVVRQGRFDEALASIEDGAYDVALVHAEHAAADAMAFLQQLQHRRLPAGLPLVLVGTQAVTGRCASMQLAGVDESVALPADVADLAAKLGRLAALHRLRRLPTSWTPPGESLLDALIDTGLKLAMERDRGKLLRHLLTEGQKLLHCDGATMYMVTEERTLRFEMRTRDDALPSLQIPLHDPLTGQPNENYVSVYTAIHNRSVVIDDVYAETRFDLSGTRAFDCQSDYRTVSMLTVPISPRGGEAVGVLQFFNALDRQSGAIVPFDAGIVHLVEALAAQAAVALDNLQLVESQRLLMESLIRLLANAIDAKSPYTGRHCERVPELGMMLAQAACDATEGPLGDFRFRSEEEWQEFRIGAWLHDCGKVTTPEYVIDKATKLETLYNRIHEVRMRFEVLWRDLEIERLQACAVRPLEACEEATFEARRRALQDDFAFIAACNIGGEAMQPADLDRLHRLAGIKWTRHFDDRLGLSAAELDRRRGVPQAPLPAVERLLADRPHDIVPRPADQQLDPAFGFRMDVPEHLYHHGELHNLGVHRGTLTPEERYKINEHMVHTIMMLERMPFPKELRRVPEYAGTHHERMDGKGYPRGLAAAQLSVPSRIMAVADVFEALTASDRPYKKAKTLSEALNVLRSMAGDHIDPHVFNLFLTSGVFLRFARKHLKPAQIDVADGTPFLVPVSHRAEDHAIA